MVLFPSDTKETADYGFISRTFDWPSQANLWFFEYHSIPGGLPSELKPLDKTVNRSFKNHLRNFLKREMDSITNHSPTTNISQWNRQLMIQAVSQSWSLVWANSHQSFSFFSMMMMRLIRWVSFQTDEFVDFVWGKDSRSTKQFNDQIEFAMRLFWFLNIFQNKRVFQRQLSFDFLGIPFTFENWEFQVNQIVVYIDPINL